MTARILDGRHIAENLLDELKAKVDARDATVIKASTDRKSR